MTPLRLALIAVSELHKAGFLNTNVVNSPAKVVASLTNKKKPQKMTMTVI